MSVRLGIVLLLSLAATTVFVPSALASRSVTADTVTVPNVVGMRLDLATKKMQGAGLRVNEECKGLFGCVIKSNWQACTQYPLGGRRVARYFVVLVYARRAGTC